jgi:hypothetical protein
LGNFFSVDAAYPFQDVDISLHVGQERSLSANSNVPLPPLPVTSQETPSTSAAFVFEATVPLMKIASRMMDEQATLSAKGSNCRLYRASSLEAQLKLSQLRGWSVRSRTSLQTGTPRCQIRSCSVGPAPARHLALSYSSTVHIGGSPSCCTASSTLGSSIPSRAPSMWTTRVRRSCAQ